MDRTMSVVAVRWRGVWALDPSMHHAPWSAAQLHSSIEDLALHIVQRKCNMVCSMLRSVLIRYSSTSTCEVATPHVGTPTLIFATR